MNTIKIDPERITGSVNRNIFGGFAEHLGRCIYGGLYEPGSPKADENGFRKDVLEALKRLRMPLIRYPGGNFASGYRWRDGIGPADQRPARIDLAWHDTESNRFGTDEFIRYCRTLGTEPYLVVNCGDGDLREARDWVEYCNSPAGTALADLRVKNGSPQPHNVRYWGIGNEVDGAWQIGYKTPQEYARACTEYAKVMKWVDPSIKVVASAVSHWDGEWFERCRLLMEQCAQHIDYLSLHWYVGNPEDDFGAYMCVPEMLEQRLAAVEGLVNAVSLQRSIKQPVRLAVDEWNVWYRTHPQYGIPAEESKLEEFYNLEDALVAALQLNLFLRHAGTVKIANIAQVVNVIAPVFTNPDGMFLQTIFYPFELYSRTCGSQTIDVCYSGDTFSSGEHKGVPTLDIAATIDETKRQLVLYVVNRSRQRYTETGIKLTSGKFADKATVFVINGPDIEAENSFEKPDEVVPTQYSVETNETSVTFSFEPHSVTAMVFGIR